MYNLDGSQGAMCGNGIRCVAKYVYDHGIVDKTSLSIATRSGIKYVDLTIRDGKASMVKVNMGSPILTAKEIPVVAETEQVIDAPITVDGKEYHMTAVSMGNPHAIIYVDDVNSLDLEKIGPSYENHPRFQPARVNSEFIEVKSRDHIRMRVWERGSGETWACGTGATASAMAAILRGFTDDEVRVSLRGGDLLIHFDRESRHLFMTGPAKEVFHGSIDIPEEIYYDLSENKYAYILSENIVNL